MTMLSRVVEPLLDGFAATGTSLLYFAGDDAVDKIVIVSGCDRRGWAWPRRSD